MRLGTPSPSSGPTHARSATSDAIFSNAIVDISRTTSCGVTQVFSWGDQKDYFLEF
jgi:hypothetical protein